MRQLVDQIDPDTGQPVNTVFMTEISLVEVASALAILNRVGRITRRDRDKAYQNFMNDAWRLFDLLSLVTADFLTAASLTQRHPLRAYDAVQLAVALHRNALLAQAKLALIFVSGDKQQLTAAEIEGLTIENLSIISPRLTQCLLPDPPMLFIIHLVLRYLPPRLIAVAMMVMALLGVASLWQFFAIREGRPEWLRGLAN